MTIDWKWLFWHVIVPLVGPIVVSGLVILAWITGPNQTFQPQFSIIVDLSPWAMTFYSLVLISSTISIMWGSLADHTGISIALFLVAGAISIYASFIVIWRHDPHFDPGRPVYGVTIFLLLTSIFLCHLGYLKMRQL